MYIFNIIVTTIRSYIEDDLFTYGAALAYYTIFSLAPGLFIVLLIAGTFFNEAEAAQSIETYLSELIDPTVASLFSNWMSNIHEYSSSWFSSISSIVVFLLGATAVFSQLHQAFNKIWHIKTVNHASGVWGFLKSRLIAISIVIVLGGTVIASLASQTILTRIKNIEQLSTFTVPIIDYINKFAIYPVLILLFAILFKILSPNSVPWRFVFPGAILSGILFIFGKSLIAYSIGNMHLSTYGAASSFIILLVWVFYSSQILFFGAEFSKTLYYYFKPVVKEATE